MKHLTFLSLILLSPLLFAAGESEASVIGISKIVAHPALDAIEQGVIDELTERGEIYQYDLQNANGDINAAATIAQKFKSDKVVLAVGVATPTAQALVENLTDIPVIYTGVTDPVAAGLVTSYDSGEEYVTGISDKTPVAAQIKLLKSLLPQMQALGHVYSGGETNAVILAEEAKAVSEELGLEFVAATVVNSSEVRSAFQSIASRVDALYVSTDNTVVSALPTVLEVAGRNDIAVFSADPSSASEAEGILLAWGFDYYKMGRATGRLISDILSGKTTARDVPTQYMEDAGDVELFIDLNVARSLGVAIPEELISQANTVIGQ